MIGYDNFASVPPRAQMFRGSSSITEMYDTSYGEIYALNAIASKEDSEGSVYGMFDGLSKLIGIASSIWQNFEVNVHGGEQMFVLIVQAMKEYS